MNYEDKSHFELLKIIDEVRDRVKKSETYRELCEEYQIDHDYIDLVPMAFTDLDVSARTEKGCIYFNFKLLDDGDFQKDDHYLLHEFKHVLQQCHGDGPTQGSDDGEYLDNKYEQEGFQVQTKYLSETRGDEAAEEYIDQVLDHHEVPPEERKKRKKELLQLASLVRSQPKQKIYAKKISFYEVE